jgi:ABC-type nitrate/sulfonate/bicarbonate transport system ATPase subunit
VQDHLLFYARLKGVEKTDEARAVDDALARVSLTNFRHRQSRGLSGGERRRLSIAIALIGDGQVIFLDEPTVWLRTHTHTEGGREKAPHTDRERGRRMRKDTYVRACHSHVGLALVQR